MSGVRVTVPPGHPALPGHFPGRPIVPGVLLLDAVFGAVAAAGGTVTRLVRAKFSAPVLPGTEVEVALATKAAGRVGFTCRAAGAVVLTGEIACAPPPNLPA
jgi:3-hydroxymyristoyl/3-hydroxydecanoyl-(acyl carrier protein) dehydratase